MNKQTKLWLGLLAFVMLLFGATFLYNTLAPTAQPMDTPAAGAKSSSDASQAEKQLAPDFTVYDQEGNPVKLSSLRGKPVVLNFWASWCPPCKAEMPYFDKVDQDNQGDVLFMMVDLVGGRETEAAGRAYVAEMGFSFPVYFDTDGEAATVYGISSIPTTLFIDKDGYVVTGAIGSISEAKLEAGVALLLEAD